MGFRDGKGGNPIAKYLFKPENDKSYIIRIWNDTLEQWSEVWPTFLGDGGSKFMRKFVASEGFANFKPLNDFKKAISIGEMFAKVEPERERKRMINNWNAGNQNATIVIIGTEQNVKAEGKVKRKIEWDREAKIYQFGSTVYKQLNAINHNPNNIEQAEKVKQLSGKMGDPDTDGEGFLCSDVYALRLTKTKSGQKIDFTTEVDKLCGPVKSINNAEEITKVLEDMKKPSTPEEIEQFLSDNSEGAYTGKTEAASTPDEIDQTPAEEESSAEVVEEVEAEVVEEVAVDDASEELDDLEIEDL